MSLQEQPHNESQHSEMLSRPPSQALLQPPNGGFNAWLQCANMFCLWFAAWGLVNSFGIFQAYYETHILHIHSSSLIAWIGSLQLFLFIAGTALIGPLFDVGHLRMQLIAGTLLTVLGLVMTSLCTAYWQFLLAQGVCTGSGMTCLFVPCVAVVPPYFSTRRALAMGIGATGGSIGAIVFTIVFQCLWPRIGFAWTTRLIAFIVLALLLLPMLTMRKASPRSPPRALIDTLAFREPASVIAYACMLLIFSGLYIPYFWIQVFAEQKSILGRKDDYLYKYLVVFLNVGSFFGRLFPSYLADKVGPINAIIPCCVMTSLVSLGWIAVHNREGLIAFCIFYGFWSGAFVSLAPVLWASLCPDMKRLGTRTGMMTVPMAVGLLIGNPIAGALIRDRGSGFSGLQIFCSITVMAGGCLLVAARVALTGLHLTQRI